MGWIIAAAVLLLVAIVPLGVSVWYDSEGFRAFVLAGPFHVQVYPARKQKKEKDVPKNKKKSATKKTANKQAGKKKQGGSIADFLPVLDRVLDFLSAFRQKLRIPRLELKLILAGDNPCDLAVSYGRGWAALGNLMPLLENALNIKSRDLEVECDFLAKSTTIIVRMDISITIGRILSLGVVHGVPIVCEFIKLMKLRKGGAKA